MTEQNNQPISPVDVQRMLYAHIMFCAALEEFASLMYGDMKKQKIFRLPPYQQKLKTVLKLIDALQNSHQSRKVLMAQKFPEISRQIREQFKDLDAVVQISSIGASLWAMEKGTRDKVEVAIDEILRVELDTSINERVDTIINHYKNKLGNEEHIGWSKQHFFSTFRGYSKP